MNHEIEDSDLTGGTDFDPNSADWRDADNDEDNDFVKRLVEAVERCVAYLSIIEEENRRRGDVKKGQGHVDFLNNKLERYTDCEIEALDNLVTSKIQDVDESMEALENAKSLLVHCVERSKQCALERRRVLDKLYGASQGPIDRFGEVGNTATPGIGLGFDFYKALANMMAQAGIVAQSRADLTKLRKQVLGLRPSNKDASLAASNKKRKEALARYRERESQLQFQCENQIESEQNFFVNSVQPILRHAGVLPDRRESVSSTSSGGLSRIARASSRGADNGRSIPVVPERGGEEAFLLQRLLDSKAVFSKAECALMALRERYATSLGDWLITFSNWSQRDFDALWATESGGRSQAVQERVARTAVRTAEEAYHQAYQAAEAAGVTALPPSPRDTGNRTHDGHTDSEHEEAETQKRRARSKRKPETRTWIKRVAKSGSPVSPSAAPLRPRSGVSKRPHGNVQPNWDFIGESEPRRSRIDRYARHQEFMRRRARVQEEQRVRMAAVTAASRASPALPQRWGCIAM